MLVPLARKRFTIDSNRKNGRKENFLGAIVRLVLHLRTKNFERKRIY